MSAPALDLDVQYLVRPASAALPSLPPLPSVLRYFQRQCRQEVSVDWVQGDSYVVTVKARYAQGYVFSKGLLWPSMDKLHIVDGYRLQAHLVVPDVYGCEVTVRERLVEVSVGPDIMAAMRRDEQWQDGFLNTTLFCTYDAVSLRGVDAGYITVTRVSSESMFFKWVWELFVIDRLIELLSPFKALFQKAPLTLRDRRLDRCSIRPAHSASFPGSADRWYHAGVRVSGMDGSVMSQDAFLARTRAAHPGVQFVCDTSHRTLKLCGGDDASTKDVVKNYIRGMFEDYVPLTATQTLMMENGDTQKWFQQCLDTKDILCAWRLRPHPNAPLLSITAQKSDIQTFKQTFRSSFQTKEVTLSRNQVDHLQSDLWKQFLDDLLMPKESSIVPALRVDRGRISLCDITTNIHNTHRAVLDFFFRSQNQLQPDLSAEVTEEITKLHPWQVAFLGKEQVRKRLPRCLQHTLSATPDTTTVRIQAPVHTFDRCVDAFWNYLVDLSRQVVPLTAAACDLLQTPVSRERVQKALEEEGVACHWCVDQQLLVTVAHSSHMPRLKQVFLSEIETGQLATTQAEREEEEDNNHEVNQSSAAKTQQRDGNRKQQTDNSRKVETPSETGAEEEEEADTRENNISTEPNRKPATIRNQCYRRYLTAKRKTQTRATHTGHLEHREQQSHGTNTEGTQSHGTNTEGTQSHETNTEGTQSHGTNTEGTQSHGTNTEGTQSRGWLMGNWTPVAEAMTTIKRAPAQAKEGETEEELANDTEAFVTQTCGNHEQRGGERNNTDDDKSYSNFRESTGLDEQPSLTETLEDQSLTFQKSVVDSQVDERADDPSYNGMWSCDVRCHPDPLAQSEEVPTPLSPHLHTPPSSFPETERSWRTSIPAGVNIRASAVSDTDVQSTHGSDVSTSSSAHVSDVSSTSSSCDSKLYMTGNQFIRKEQISYSNVRGCPDRSRVIYPLNAYEPIAQNPVDLLNTTDISSVNSTRSPTPSAGQEEDDERHVGPLAPEVSRRTLSGGLAVGDGRFERSRHPQQTRSPRGGNSLVTQALRPLNVGPARRRLVGDCAEGGRSGPQLPASLRPQQRRRRGQRGRCSRPAVPDLHSGKDPRHGVPPPAGPPSHLQGPCTARIRRRPQPSHLQGPRTARISRRPQPECLRRSTETTEEGLSCSNCQLEYQRGPRLSRQRRQRHQHHSSACLHEDLLYYVLGKLDRPEYRCARREDAGRERTPNRGGDGCSTDSGDAGDASRDREGLGNDVHQQMDTVVRMLAQLQQQLTNDNASDGLAVENCSDVETVSSTASWSQQQQRQQPQQQQQHDSALYSDIFCAVM